MKYKSVFDFLKDEDTFKDVYKHCKGMEKEIITESYYNSFVEGRKVCEKLIKKFAKSNSKISPIFNRKRNGKPYPPGLSKLLWLCDINNVLKHDVLNKYYNVVNLIFDFMFFPDFYVGL